MELELKQQAYCGLCKAYPIIMIYKTSDGLEFLRMECNCHSIPIVEYDIRSKHNTYGYRTKKLLDRPKKLRELQ